MSYDLFQTITVFVIVAFSMVQLLRKLMPVTMRNIGQHLFPHHTPKTSSPATGCSDCSTCSACSTVAKFSSQVNADS